MRRLIPQLVWVCHDGKWYLVTSVDLVFSSQMF
jgi:hypothetical protein